MLELAAERDAAAAEADRLARQLQSHQSQQLELLQSQLATRGGASAASEATASPLPDSAGISSR